MPVSEKQLRANRANARKSTGPKSVEGKQMVRHNSVTYGLYTKDIIINSPNLKESKEEYDQLLNSLLDEFQPQTGFQLHLVHKIADCLWRSRRAIRAETAVVTRQLDHIDRDVELRNQYLTVVHHMDGDGDDEYEMTPEEEEHFREIEIGRQSIPKDPCAVNILRYEMRLDRQLTRAYKLLCQLQDRQNRNQTETDGREEIFVPVFKCPAEHGMECPRNPQRGEEHPDAVPGPPVADPHRPGDDSDGADVDPLQADRPQSPPRDFVDTPEEGFERPTVDMPTEDPVSLENLTQTTSDAVEFRPRGAGGEGSQTHEKTKNDKPNPFPRNESVAAGLSRQGPPEADDLPPFNRGDGMGKNIKNDKPNPFPRNRKRGMHVQRKMAGFPEVNQ